MTRNKQVHFVMVGCLSLMVQGCSLPAIATKKASATLPARYASSTQESASSASVNWKEFFEDTNLSGLIETAIANNKEVNIALQRISMASNEIQARRGEYLPSVKIGASSETEKVGRYTRNGAVEESLQIKEETPFPKLLGNHQFGLFSTWEIDVWKKLRNATKAAVAEYMASVEGKNFLLTNLVAEVAHSYYELIALDNQLENLVQSIQIQQKALEAVTHLQQYGKATGLAVKRYDAEVKKNQSQQYVIKQKVAEVENRINFLLGRTPQPVQRASAGFMNIKPKMIQAGIPSQLLQNRPDIRKAELELSAANLNIEVARANFYPSFGIKAGLGFQAFNPRYLLSTPESVMLSIGGEVMAPLVNRNAIAAQFKNANAMQIQAAYDYEQTIIKAYSEVASQMSNIDNLDKSFQLKSKQVDVLTESVDVANQLFQSARADYVEVLSTQREALEAKMELIETKQKQIVATVDLYRALGGGWK